MPAQRKYPAELRERAVRMYREAEPKPVVRQMARQLGVHPEALRNWIRQDEADAGERTDRLSTPEREELVALRRENAELRRANEILKVASTAMAAMVIMATVIQPRTVARTWLRLAPMSCRLREMIMTTIRKGAAAIPLMMADNTGRVIGLIEVRVRTAPPTVPAAIRA